MKAGYESPAIKVEEYELNTAIASGCESVVNIGSTEGEDADGVYHTICSDYKEETFDLDPSVQNFWSSCSCYLSAGGSTVFTS